LTYLSFVGGEQFVIVFLDEVFINSHRLFFLTTKSRRTQRITKSFVP